MHDTPDSILADTIAAVNQFIVEKTHDLVHKQIVEQNLIRTGTLLNTFETRLHGDEMWIEMQDYGVYLELGTRKMEPRAFIRKAINKLSLENFQL
jgi:hypothetical protein